ncbi:MAG: hypothetical protein JXA97_09460 [Anaerolineales bacterium]|nr:hypothetical protein [Anaerolineales bacterium]
MKKMMVFLALLLCLTGCTGEIGLSSESRAPTPMPLQSQAASAAANLTLLVNPPVGTSANVRIALEIIDEITGMEEHSRVFTLKRTAQGQYTIDLTPAVGTILYYRFVRMDPDASPEVTPLGEPAYRRAAIMGSETLEDTIAGWEDAPYSGGTGRITGTVESSESGQPLGEMVVYGGGQSTFTDQYGQFQFNGLQPGYHRITVLSPSGAFHTVQQGAYVDVYSATPTSFAMPPAAPVQVAFQVTVPADTLPGSQVRVLGSSQQLGFRFSADGPGELASALAAPTMYMVDETHYILVTTLYAGMDLRYKYTLGNGIWNAEHDPAGSYVTRQIIVPESDLVLEDSVSTWHGDNQSTVRFHVTVPSNTPSEDDISLQLDPSSGLEAIPMWELGENEWYYILYSPLAPGDSISYRYCRSQRCGSADDARTTGANPEPRTVEISTRAQNVEDRVDLWQWWGLAGETSTVVAPEISPRAGMHVGVAFLPVYSPVWNYTWHGILTQLANLSVNSVILTPSWSISGTNPTPLFQLDPARSPLMDELIRISESLVSEGIVVSLQPHLLPASGQMQDWWQTGSLDRAWWNVWFEQYEAFLLNYAAIAEDISAQSLVLGGAELAPALPGGLLPDGSPSNVPQDAADRWAQLIRAVRQIYHGTLVFELDFTGNVDAPGFLTACDEVQLYWHPPLAEGAERTVADLQAVAGSYLDRIQAVPALRAIPIRLVVEYLSIDGGASACAGAPDGRCRSAGEFDQGAPVDADLDVNLTEQAQAINAVLLALLTHDEITGFYVARYDPGAALQDKSASVHGKPAADVLWYWYPRLAP